MPPLMHLDPIEVCDLDPDSIYCIVEIELVSDEPSQLLDMIKEYSDYYTTHYNHTNLHYGICLTDTCRKFYEKDKKDLKVTLETCFNESLLSSYNLKARVSDDVHCKPLDVSMKKIDMLDITIGTICLTILFVNIVGSLIDSCIVKSENYGVLRILLCFSLQRNWKKLIAVRTNANADTIEKRLSSLHGLRVFMMIVVVVSHTIFIPMILSENPKYIEQIYESPYYFLLQNGSVFIQMFFVLSGFLFVYNWLSYSKENEVSWYTMMKYVISRWLRFTPAYAVTLALTATWLGHLQRRGTWSKYVADEMNACRDNWWQNILYINNYYKNSQCMPHSWYVATDMQLCYLGAIIYMTCKTMGARKIVISLLFVIGMILPAAHVYFQDLDGIMLFTPETVRKLCIDHDFYDFVYKRGYNNIPNYLVGMAIGYILHHWQKQGINYAKYEKLIYRVLFWFLILLVFLCLFFGNNFYSDLPRPTIYTRMLYAALMKPVIGILIGVLLIGLMLKFEGMFNTVLEWRGWIGFSRLTYSVYLLHSIVIKASASTRTRTIQLGIVAGFQICLSMVVMTFLAAAILWLFVESPFAKLMHLFLAPQRKKKEVDSKI